MKHPVGPFLTDFIILGPFLTDFSPIAQLTLHPTRVSHALHPMFSTFPRFVRIVLIECVGACAVRMLCQILDFRHAAVRRDPVPSFDRLASLSADGGAVAEKRLGTKLLSLFGEPHLNQC